MTTITSYFIRFRHNVIPVKHSCFLNIFTHTQRAGYAEKAAESLNFEENNEFSEEEKLKQIRNISRLQANNYNKLHGIPPYSQAHDAHHHTLRWKRRMVGLYGLDCGTDPAICFSTKQEMEDLREYEKVAFDKSIREIRDNHLRKQAEEKEERKMREERVAESLLKTAEWKQQIRERVEKKGQEVSQAKLKRERLLEEVRRYFGYTIDTRDEKFQIMLEFKELEQKKQSRLEKKKRKEELLMEKLASLESGTNRKDPSPSQGQKGDNNTRTDSE